MPRVRRPACNQVSGYTKQPRDVASEMVSQLVGKVNDLKHKTARITGVKFSELAEVRGTIVQNEHAGSAVFKWERGGENMIRTCEVDEEDARIIRKHEQAIASITGALMRRWNKWQEDDEDFRLPKCLAAEEAIDEVTNRNGAWVKIRHIDAIVKKAKDNAFYAGSFEVRRKNRATKNKLAADNMATERGIFKLLKEAKRTPPVAALWDEKNGKYITKTDEQLEAMRGNLCITSTRETGLAGKPSWKNMAGTCPPSTPATTAYLMRRHCTKEQKATLTTLLVELTAGCPGNCEGCRK